MSGGPLYLGLDLGTSGVRSAAIDAAGAPVSEARAAYPPAPEGETSADRWRRAAEACLDAQRAALREIGRDMAEIAALAIDGTSGTIVLTDADLIPVTPGLMYDSSGFEAEAEAIAAHAPDPHIARGPGSALARMLRLQSLPGASRAAHLLHQADFILCLLLGRGGVSDDSNALKLGWDPEARAWPDWYERVGVRPDLLPKPLRVGESAGTVSPDAAARFGFCPNLRLCAGASDSTAAFLAAGATGSGDAVTSLGSTLAIKMLTDTRIDAPALGVYSHFVHGRWLAGGASNTGGRALLAHFCAEEIARLSERIDPARPTGLDYYPLLKPGERFPVNDPALPPRLAPRPEDDALFLQAMFEGVAAVEARGYAALRELGARGPRRVLTCGGGAINEAWTRIRAAKLGVPVERAAASEASVGMARLSAGLTA